MFSTGPLRALAAAFLLIVSAVGAGASTSDAPPAQGRRLAIVVGNSTYDSTQIEQLANAANDARRLSESLKRLNFDVLMEVDATADAFGRLLAEAERRLPQASAVLIFYAGHGVQINGENYLLPKDTLDPQDATTLMAKAIRLNEVIARVANRDRPTFVFLDACRDNPLGAAGGQANGLAQVEVGENTFIAFATQPGNVTADGTGENSPFTTALLQSLEIPGLSISDMMIRVRNETEALTIGRQVPWDQSNLREQFYFTEQQVLDPAQLSASLSQILADPAAKQRLQIELATSDLQTAVLIVGQSLRSVSGPGAAPAEEPAGTQVASLSTSDGIDGAKSKVMSELGTLIIGSAEADGAAEKQQQLVRSIQTELRRLGCYRMEVDGDWGKGSVRALKDYYRNTKQDSGVTDPSVGLLSDLFLRSGRICREPVIVKRTKPQSTVASAERGSDGVKKPRGGTKPVAKRAGTKTRKPASSAPPPDINAGIGIGGVF